MNNCNFGSLCSQGYYALQEPQPARPAARNARMVCWRFGLWHKKTGERAGFCIINYLFLTNC